MNSRPVLPPAVLGDYKFLWYYNLVSLLRILLTYLSNADIIILINNL